MTTATAPTKIRCDAITTKRLSTLWLQSEHWFRGWKKLPNIRRNLRKISPITYQISSTYWLWSAMYHYFLLGVYPSCSSTGFYDLPLSATSMVLCSDIHSGEPSSLVPQCSGPANHGTMSETRMLIHRSSFPSLLIHLIGLIEKARNISLCSFI